MRWSVLLFVTGCGLFAVAVSTHYLFEDWAALNAAWARFEKLAMSAADLRSIVIADARQNAFRTNCFADGVGVLLGGILAAVGLHGLCTLPRRT
jgi:hypothetical protein